MFGVNKEVITDRSSSKGGRPDVSVDTSAPFSDDAGNWFEFEYIPARIICLPLIFFPQTVRRLVKRQ